MYNDAKVKKYKEKKIKSLNLKKKFDKINKK